MKTEAKLNRFDKILQLWHDGPDHPMKLRLYRNAVRRVRTNLAYTSTPYGGFIVDQDDYIGNLLLNEKVYEPKTLALCERLLISGGTFFDIGANLGLYTVAMSRNPDTHVFAFEPDAFNYMALKRNIALNERHNVILFNMALSSAPGLLTLELPSTDNLGRISVRGEFGNGSSRAIVSSSTIDEVIRFTGIAHIDVLKIDVEGHELEVLRGLSFDRLAPKHIIAEYLGESNDTKRPDILDSELYEFLRQRGYRCRTILSEPVVSGKPLPECNAWFSLD